MFLFYVLTFFKKGDIIQMRTLFKEIRYVTRFPFDILFQIVSLTELMAGVKASTKTYKLFQITQFPFPVLLKNMGN